jgi:predicted nuclease of predicted toxin-antitoxin system
MNRLLGVTTPARTKLWRPGNVGGRSMPSEGTRLRFLLDEHCPGWLAEDLAGDGLDAVALTAHRPELRGADDERVLSAAVAERRIVVTEDVSTFSAAAAIVPHHVGIVYCHHARFPRTRPGLERLCKALGALASDPPAGLGEHPIVWWLS